ncbi:hypothetical protein Lal_00045299 [Lupinus albus]|nr:hypothetical protein Lal_00045299 [Lupinus albus]
MPNPKVGTVTLDGPGRLMKLKSCGQYSCTDRKVSFDSEKLLQNFRTIVDTLLKVKPAAAKGQYMRSITLSTTMGPGGKGQQLKIRSCVAKFREAGVEYKVVKNTLTRIAANEIGIAGLDSYLKAQLQWHFQQLILLLPAKIISDFIKESKLQNIEVKAGLVEGKVITADGVKALANLPPRGSAYCTSTGWFPKAQIVGYRQCTSRHYPQCGFMCLKRSANKKKAHKSLAG